MYYIIYNIAHVVIPPSFRGGGHAMSIEPQESNDAMDIIGPYDLISHVHIVVIKYTYYRMRNGTSYTTLFAMYNYSTSPRYGEQRFQGADTSRP